MYRAVLGLPESPPLAVELSQGDAGEMLRPEGGIRGPRGALRTQVLC